MQSIQEKDVLQFAAAGYFTSVRNPKWDNVEHTSISCEVNFMHVGFEEWTPFCADPTDYMPYSKIIFDECVAGKWGVVSEFIVAEPELEIVREPLPEERLAALQARREAIIAQANNGLIPGVIL